MLESNSDLSGHPYPLHEQILAREEEWDAINAFLAWGKRFQLPLSTAWMSLKITYTGRGGDVTTDYPTQAALFAYFNIDPQEFKAEENRMLQDCKITLKRMRNLKQT